MLDLGEAQKHGITLQTVMRRHIRELERLQQKIEKSPHPERGHLLLQAPPRLLMTAYHLQPSSRCGATRG